MHQKIIWQNNSYPKNILVRKNVFVQNNFGSKEYIGNPSHTLHNLLNTFQTCPRHPGLRVGGGGWEGGVLSIIQPL